LQDSLWTVLRFRDQEVYAVFVAAFASELHPCCVADIVPIEEVANIFKEKASDPWLAHHKHVIDG